MSGPRVALSVPGADAAEIARLAPLAEAHNLDAMVVGNPRGDQPNSDDTYVVTAAAAAAALTRYLRIAVALDLRGSAPPLRVAEDIGVLDVMSGGRLELLLRPAADPSWAADLEAVLGAWNGWPLDDGRTMPVTPSPVQPEIPYWLMRPSDPPTAEAPRGRSSMLFLNWPGPGHIPELAGLERVRRIRDEAGAATVVLDISATPGEARSGVIAVLGTVLAPCLRCADDEVGILALDTADWLLRRRELHRPPVRDAGRI